MTESDTTVRLDIWLDVACVFKTRSEAQRACTAGKVEVNGERVKPHRQLRVGDRLDVNRPFGRKQTLVVKGLAERHVPKAEARALYTDTTPPMPEEEREIRRMDRIYRAGMHRAHAPDKRQRRQLRKLKGKA